MYVLLCICVNVAVRKVNHNFNANKATENDKNDQNNKQSVNNENNKK